LDNKGERRSRPARACYVPMTGKLPPELPPNEAERTRIKPTEDDYCFEKHQ
jgi:hypothetical protein